MPFKACSDSQSYLDNIKRFSTNSTRNTADRWSENDLPFQKKLLHGKDNPVIVLPIFAIA